jgi:hypothetical protein
MKNFTSIALLALLAAACGDTSAADALFGGGVSTGKTSGPGSSTDTGGTDTSSSSSTATTTTSHTATGAGGVGGTTTTGAGGVGGTTTTGAGGVGGSSTTGAGGVGGSTTGAGGAGGFTTTSAGGSGGSTTTSTTNTVVNESGCSDGEREYFMPYLGNAYKDIAGCAGGFFVSGITTPASMQPQCGRNSGDDSANPNGQGCSVEDLCSAGWHVCKSAGEVKNKSGYNGYGGGCASLWNAPDQLWLTRQAQLDNGDCAGPPAKNNLTGCGTGFGSNPDWSCGPLNRSVNYQACIPTKAWFCGNGQQNDPNSGLLNEAEIVQKQGPEEGGVICCRD